ncbi:MAG: hypothetical protein RMK74_17320 [Myxococcales bacterium]|nr:hypothetical protein [Myxococcales bacterium]
MGDAGVELNGALESAPGEKEDEGFAHPRGRQLRDELEKGELFHGCVERMDEQDGVGEMERRTGEVLQAPYGINAGRVDDSQVVEGQGEGGEADADRDVSVTARADVLVD